MARLLLGVTGSIAAYKALELVRLATAAGHAVRVIQTPAAERFVARASFASLSGAPVLGDEFEEDPLRGAYPGELAGAEQPISHLALVGRADAYLIAPASANTLAKLAHGMAGDLVSTAALAAPCPVAVAPAMNHRMWLAAATQANVACLRERGVRVIEPGEGRLASAGEHGLGRLAEPADLLEEVEAMLAIPSLGGLRVLVSAGGTREAIDAVRFIGNRSSGRMGLALARAAARRGARTTLVAANVALPAPPGVEVVAVTSAAELADACRERFDACDVLLMAAAVADFRPASPAAGKLKKDGLQTPRAIELEPTADVLATLAARRSPGQVLVGFAAEHGPEGLANARAKLERKGLDAIVLNDVSQDGIGFDSPDNEVTIITADGQERPVARASKERVAEEVCDVVVALRERRRREADGSGRAPAADVSRA